MPMPMPSIVETLTCSLLQLQFQMPILQSCKDAAWAFVSCCDRRTTSRRINSAQYREDEDCPPHTATSASLRYQTSRRWKIQPKRLKTKWKRERPECIPPPSGGGGIGISQEANPRKDRYDYLSEDISQRVFSYDSMVFGDEKEKVIYRRILLDFRVNIDAISDEIPRLLDLPVVPYNGLEVQLPNGYYVKPMGMLEAEWQIYEGRRSYKTKFLVIKDSQFDMMLGRSSIQRYKLWDEDGDIWRRLQCQC